MPSLIQVTGTIILWHKYLPDSALLICHKQRFGRFKADVGGILKGSRRWRQPEVMSGLLLSRGILTHISQTRHSDPSPAPETQSRRVSFFPYGCPRLMFTLPLGWEKEQGLWSQTGVGSNPDFLWHSVWPRICCLSCLT